MKLQGRAAASLPELALGMRVRFLPPLTKGAYDAGLEGKTGTVIGGPWGRVVRVQVDHDGRVWLTSPMRLELIDAPLHHPEVRAS